MELKPIHTRYRRVVVFPSNCTNMELKRFYSGSFNVDVEASNCTNMELKPTLEQLAGNGTPLLIAPIWN